MPQGNSIGKEMSADALRGKRLVGIFQTVAAGGGGKWPRRLMSKKFREIFYYVKEGWGQGKSRSCTAHRKRERDLSRTKENPKQNGETLADSRVEKRMSSLCHDVKKSLFVPLRNTTSEKKRGGNLKENPEPVSG